MGNKILRERLKGAVIAAYYPRNSATIADIQKEFSKFDMETWNEEEEDRLESLQIAKLRGKGAPKKKTQKDSRYSRSHSVQTILTKTQQAKRGRRRGDEHHHEKSLYKYDDLYEDRIYGHSDTRDTRSCCGLVLLSTTASTDSPLFPEPIFHINAHSYQLTIGSRFGRCFTVR